MGTMRLWKFGALTLAVVLGCVVVMSQAQVRPGTASTSVETGRYQIVNGTPAMARNIMLLDTWTGTTWITCENEQDGTNWCAMSRTYTQTGQTPTISEPPPSIPSSTLGPGQSCAGTITAAGCVPKWQTGGTH